MRISLLKVNVLWIPSLEIRRKRMIRQQKVQKIGYVSKIPKTERNMHLKLNLLVKKDNSWYPELQKSLDSCYHVFFSINMLYSLWFTERSDFIVILPQVIFGNITVHKVAVENDLKAATACAWIQANGSAVEIKYTTKSDSCGETTALRMLLFNNSVTITVLGNDWWAFLLQLIILNYYFFNCCIRCMK